MHVALKYLWIVLCAATSRVVSYLTPLINCVCNVLRFVFLFLSVIEDFKLSN